jgi:hypothetical protein
VIKYDKDVRTALDALPRLVDPNAQLPEAHGHGHGHGHGHSDHVHDDDLGGADGREVRVAMDRPGRHGAGVYGTPDYAKDADPPPARPRNVPSSQGSRSFGLGRKRAL